MRVTRQEFNTMKEFLLTKDFADDRYVDGFVRLYKMLKDYSNPAKLKLDIDYYKANLKDLYIINRIRTKRSFLLGRDFDESINREIHRNIKTLTMLAYMRAKNFNEIGICGTCNGSAKVADTSYMSHCGDWEYCDCYWNTFDGWELKTPTQKQYREFKRSLLDTNKMIELLEGFDEYKN